MLLRQEWLLNFSLMRVVLTSYSQANHMVFRCWWNSATFYNYFSFLFFFNMRPSISRDSNMLLADPSSSSRSTKGFLIQDLNLKPSGKAVRYVFFSRSHFEMPCHLWLCSCLLIIQCPQPSNWHTTTEPNIKHTAQLFSPSKYGTLKFPQRQ